YLKTEHTLKHYKERWYPDLFERDTYDSWHGKGAKTLSERAGERASLILAEHKPEPLRSKIKEKLQGFVQKAKTS
ncbi:MAG: trimethylamine methyltransferase family protein, partial [Candidatus Aminicenantaceae bacterium]